MESVDIENSIITNDREIILNSTPEEWIKRNFSQRSCTQPIHDKDKKYEDSTFLRFTGICRLD